jgi:hypothetical protein
MTGNARTDHAGRTIHYHNLGGCVNDSALVETFLKEIGVPSDHVIKLKSSPPVDAAQNTPREDPAVWPTYSNIAQAFKDLHSRAGRGDFVYIHYSGHGARVQTAYPDLKGPDGFDEVLVPIDIEVISPTRQSRYIRDIEIASWMRDFVDKGLRVTLVLDSCHAGSSNRSRGDTTTRGIDAVDYSLLPRDLPVSLPDHRQPPAGIEAFRGGRLRRNWLLEASGYMLLAACTAYERAHEFQPAERKHGVLSYYLVESLRSGHASVSPSGLLGRLIAKVQSQFPGQTPILDGCDNGAAFFGIHTLPPAPQVSVVSVDSARDSVELNHGDLHGLHVGAQYGLHGSDENVSQAFAARARIAEVRGLTSIAHIIPADGCNPRAVRPGYLASLVQPAREKLNLVRVIAGGVTIRQPDLATRLELLQRLLENPRHSPGRLWRPMTDDDGDETAYFSVRISEDGCYELLDASQVSVPNLPRLHIMDAASGDRLLHCLDHLTQFRLLQRLSADRASVLKTPCRFDFLGKSTGPPLDPTPDGPGDLVFPEGLEQVEPVDGSYTVKHEEVVSIRFKNFGGSTVYFAAFNVKPLWGVKKLYPAGEGWAEPVGPGEERVLPIQMEIPQPLLRGGRTEILDTFKAVVTMRETPLKVFELPEILQESPRGCPTGDFWTNFDRFLQGLCLDSRDAKLKGQSRGAWQVYDVRIRTVSESKA